MSKFYFYAVDPGAVAVMSEITDSVPCGVEFRWLAEGYASEFLKKKGIGFLEVDELLASKKPDVSDKDVLILGSQHDTIRTARLIERSCAVNLKTAFVFDHWSNYGRHFHLGNDRYIFPDKILVMDELALSHIRSAGAAQSAVAVVGHPAIERHAREYRQIPPEKRSVIRTRLGISPREKLILIVTEPLADDRLKYELGFDEYDMVLNVLEALSDINDELLRPAIRLHPRQNYVQFESFLTEYAFDPEWLLDQGFDGTELLLAADLVVGMTSVFLLQAVAVGKSCISVQIGRKIQGIEAACPHLEDIIVTDRNRLREALCGSLNKKEGKVFHLPCDATKRIWRELTDMVDESKKEERP